MLPGLIRFALSQRLLMLLLTVMLTAGGIHAFLGLPIDAFPDVSSTQVKIILKAPGMTPEEVETRLAVPVEQEMLGIPHQRLLRSVSKYALTDITIDFEDGTDIYWARQQVGERLAGAMDNLPPGVGGGLAPITTPLGEMFMFTIEGDLPLAERRALLDWVIRPQLRTIPGVADVNSLGGEVRSFEVSPNPQLLAARGITLRELQAALAANNRNDGAGRLNDGEESLLVRAEGAIRNLDDVRAIVVRGGNVAVVRIGDVAAVRFGALTRYGAVTRNGSGETVQGLVLGLRGANARAVVAGVKEKLAEIAPALPEGVRIEPFYDRSELVDRAVATVAKALLEAIVLVVLLLLAFLGNLRAALVVALMLPLSALATFILMRLFGLSANLMSLGGLAIAIGMLVDAAVVVVENIESEFAGAGDQLPTLHLIFRAAREVAAPVTSGIVIIILVFLPLLTLQGLEGKMFAPVALTIVFALAASLLLSLTVVPVIASWLIRRGVHHEPWLVRKLAAIYDRLLALTLAHSRRFIVGALIALLAAAGAFGLLGKSFMPTMDEGDLIMQLEKLPSIGLDQTLAVDSRVQQAILSSLPEVKGIVARAGADELGLDPMGLNQTDTFMVLKPRDSWRNPDPAWLADQLRAVMSDFPGIGYSFTQPIDMRVSEMLTGVRGDLAIKIYGPDLATLNQLAVNVENTVKTVKGAEDTFTLKNDGVQYLKVAIDRLAAGRLGLNVEDIQNDLKALLEGRSLGIIIADGRRTPLVLRGPASLRDSPADFSALRISLPDGGSVPLASIARIERIDGPVKVDRENAQRYVVIQSNVRDRDLVGFVDDAKAAVAREVPLPPGYHLAWGGQFENQQRAAARLMIVVPIALALIFFLLFSTFRSLRQALLVLANIPFAMIGGIFGLLITGEYLSVPASVGFIALLGIAVLNGVVMVTYFNQLLARGMPLAEAIAEGARRRLRPVLMTASIAAIGLLPMLFASGPGAEVQRPLAVVVIGGLLTSTTLTLLLLPILFKRYGVEPGVAFRET
ncbi:efflux RND transporter permease subunit [Dechloromonas sp.]|uniref:efflux RND transporter permease subunit n=1 Tax=Dechloromonas sp. TaxID=1917218 RepID=UPI0011F5B007|nr:CusA/CzcA family heavy metal efflux RND transporter [Dechloromonas sp.]MBU3696664.1 efflux RND transporter permease subunit [Dechloromonas sp.]TEX44654.1 MAG: CusA/CzcA family heavy metal efflux RND transporter [Rhodocyclaceae bacterium]